MKKNSADTSENHRATPPPHPTLPARGAGRAEESPAAQPRAGARPPEKKGPPEGHEALHLLHELEVHQAELVQQNAELREVREELEKTLEQYTELYDFAPVGYFTLDTKGHILSVNLTGASLVGTERRPLIGRSFSMNLHPNDIPEFTSFLGRVFSSGSREELEVRLEPARRGAPKRFVKLEAEADSTGVGCRLAVIDITKRKQAEQELDQYRARLERVVQERTESLEAEIAERKRAEEKILELNATLEQRVTERTAELKSTIRDLQTFSYSVSHDLRSPLRSINSFAAVLLEDYGERLDEEGKRLLQTIAKRTVTMGALIDDLLSFSRNSRQQMILQPIDMTQLARESREKVAGGTPGPVEIKVAELPPAKGDRAMVMQVLENLLANAVKFSGKTEHPAVEVGAFAGGEENVYFVRDNGIGFDMKYGEAIFGVFQRLHSPEEFEGTGVGLAIVKQVITKHGGRVWAESEPGKGATFFFSLPRP